MKAKIENKNWMTLLGGQVAGKLKVLATMLMVMSGSIHARAQSTTPFITGLSVSQSYVNAGTNATVTAYVFPNAPAGGYMLTLSSALPSLVQPPSQVFVLAGTSEVVFPVKTFAVNPGYAAVRITAKMGSSTKFTDLTLVPPISLWPEASFPYSISAKGKFYHYKSVSIYSGRAVDNLMLSTTGGVEGVNPGKDYPAIALAYSRCRASFPSGQLVPVGGISSSIKFESNFYVYTATQNFTCYNGSYIGWLAFQSILPSQVMASTSAQGTVCLTEPAASASGIAVQLLIASGDKTAVQIPSSVTVPSRVCGGVKNIGQVVVTDTHADGTFVNPSDCSVSKQRLDLRQFVFAAYAKSRLGLQEGIFVKVENKPIVARIGALEEVWCRNPASSVLTGLDVVIRGESRGGAWSATIITSSYDKAGNLVTWESQPTIVAREIELRERVRYRSADGFRMEIRTKTFNQSLGTMTGQFRDERNGYNSEVELNCRTGGDLDILLQGRPFDVGES